MKKIIVAFIITTIVLYFSSYAFVYADDVVVNEDEETENFSQDEYLPSEIKDLLNKNNISSSTEIEFAQILKLIGKAFASTPEKYTALLSSFTAISILNAVFTKFFEEKRFFEIIKYIFTLLNTVNIFSLFSLLLDSASRTVESLTDILKLILPAICSVLTLSGCTFSVLSATASVSAVLAFINNVLLSFLTPCTTILLVLMIFEKLSSYISEINAFKHIKDLIMYVIKMLSTCLISVVTFQNIISISKDSASIRGLRFAAANFIPIIGSAVSESARTLSAGIKLLKTTVGGSCLLALIITTLPVITEIIYLKFILNIIGIICSALGIKSERSIIDSSLSIIDIINGTVVFSLITTSLLLIIFIVSGFLIG